MEIAVNELSACGAYNSPQEARAGMRRFIDVSRAVFRLGAERTLRTTSDFMGRELARDYPVARWLNDGVVDREERLFFKVIATKPPFLDDLMAQAEERQGTVLEFEFDEIRALGLGMAYLWDAPAVSLDGDERFRRDMVAVSSRSFGNTEVLLEEEVEVCCLSRLPQVESRKGWIASRIQREVKTGEDLYRRREVLLPNLLFSDDAPRQLCDLNGRESFFQQVCRHLFVLNEYVGGWYGGAFSMAGIAWSEESEETLHHPEYGPMRRFACPDGNEQTFSLHTKPSGGNVRIHFFPIREKQQAFVAYIGPHLPTVTHRH